MKHTPGEWWAEGRYIAAKVPGGRPNGEIIATFGPTAGSLRGKIPDEANAQIAAAAPDLLKACHKVMTVLSRCKGEDSLEKEIFLESDLVTDRLLHEARAACETAIAKAEESP